MGKAYAKSSIKKNIFKLKYLKLEKKSRKYCCIAIFICRVLLKTSWRNANIFKLVFLLIE